MEATTFMEYAMKEISRKIPWQTIVDTWADLDPDAQADFLPADKED